MQTLHRASKWPSFLCSVVRLALVAGALSCADDGAPVVVSEGAPPPRRAAPSASATALADAAPPQAPAIDIAGRLVDDQEEAVIGRPITIVDRRGRRQDVLTDEEGGFHIMGVAPPYDLLVAAAPSGAVLTPLVYLGLNRADPRLEVFESEGPLPLPQSQPLRVGVRLPPCPAVWGACWVSVVSASPSGGGGTAGSYIEGTASATFELDHSWRDATLAEDETINVHVLVGDAQYTQYSYTRMSGIVARPGEPTELGMLTPVTVEAGAPLTVAGQATVPLPADWQWSTSSELDLEDGASIGLRYEFSSTSTLRIPNIAGATWHVATWTQHPPTPDDAYFHRSTQAWSGTLPLAASNVALGLPLTPEPKRPLNGGTLSRKGLGFAWDGTTPALAALVLVDADHGVQRFRAFTAEAEISQDRLEALGLPRLLGGQHVFDLTTTPGQTVDLLTEPDAARRMERFDQQSPGSATYQRFRFVVTP